MSMYYKLRNSTLRGDSCFCIIGGVSCQLQMIWCKECSSTIKRSLRHLLKGATFTIGHAVLVSI